MLPVNGRITVSSGCVRVDFGSCTYNELHDIYRAFAFVCADKHADRALLKAGDDDPEGHDALSDAVQAMARRSPLRSDFKLALVPSTGPIEAVYREKQRLLRAAGVNAWVFGTEGDALEWLEGRATDGPTAS